MGEALAIFLAALGVFTATNIDNAILIALVASVEGYRRSGIVSAVVMSIGLLLGMVAIVLVVSPALPATSLRWLGIVPLLLGLRALFAAGERRERRGPSGSIPALAMLLVANSGDTLAALVPLAAETEKGLRLPLFAGVAAGGVLLILVGGLAGRRGPANGPLAKHGDRIGALVMIAAGLYVLADTGTDSV